jgi:dTDP-4-dehydrorhamnose 3,5-epimerase
MPFAFRELEIPGAVLIEPAVIPDARGFFLEVFKASEFARAGVPTNFAQENHSASTRGVLRGLHYQRAPKSQGKLVRVVSGSIFDVIVDMREDSPTCGKWVSAELSAENRHLLYVPPWCAHGFCVTSERAEIVYLVTEEYSPQDEGGVAWNDPELGIRWPIGDPILSRRDTEWGSFEPMALTMFGPLPSVPLLS